jgi:hypothetical protein
MFPPVQPLLNWCAQRPSNNGDFLREVGRVHYTASNFRSVTQNVIVIELRLKPDFQKLK